MPDYPTYGTSVSRAKYVKSKIDAGYRNIYKSNFDASAGGGMDIDIAELWRIDKKHQLPTVSFTSTW